jgi:beta-phosphoglucomutase family hydrolase
MSLISHPAVVFDMDGVLVDSYQAHFESWQQLYAELGVAYTEQSFAADFGRTSRDILRRTLDTELTDQRIKELDARKEALFRDIIRDNFPAMDGATELIEALAADGFRLAVGSSGPPENIELILEKLPGGRFIDVSVTGADVTRGKPDPQVFLIAAERLGVPPSDCAVVEDAVHGIEAALRAGMRAVALTGTATADEFESADWVVDRLSEITPAALRALLIRPRT